MVCDPMISLEEREAQLLDIVDDISSPTDINTTGTAQNLAFDWLVNDDLAQVCPEDMLDVVQRYVMAVLYYSLNGPAWDECNAPSNGGTTVNPCPGIRYLSPSNVCLWYNVTCDEPNGNIIEITLGKHHVEKYVHP